MDLTLVINPQVVTLLQDLGRLGNGIAGGAVTTEMGRDIRLEETRSRIDQSSLRPLNPQRSSATHRIPFSE